MFLTNICELRGTHQNSGHSHYNNELRHQNIELKKKKLCMLNSIIFQKKFMGNTLLVGIKKVDCHLVLNLEC